METSAWWLCLYLPTPADWKICMDWIGSYTPQIYIRDSHILLCEIGHSQSLIRKNDLVQKVYNFKESKEDFARLQIGEAETPAEAIIRAQFQKIVSEEWPLEALIYFLEPFRENALESKKVLALIQDLKKLGMRNVSQFLEFSEKEVGLRWSYWGRRLWLSARGDWPAKEPEVQCAEVFEESFEFPEEAPERQLEPLYFIGKQLLQKLQKRLSQKNLGARSIIISLTGTTDELDFCGTLEFHLTLPAFYSEVNLWLGLLRERLQSLHQQQKLPAQLEVLQIRVEETIVWQGLQRDLFDPHRESRECGVVESLKKIEARLGSSNIFCAEPKESYRPEKSWSRGTANEWFQLISKKSQVHQNGGLYDFLSQKPLKVFPQIIPLKFKGESLWIENQWQRCQITWQEIIAGEFWKDSFRRCYGVAHLAHGQKLWIFREGDQIFLQGEFL